MVDLIMHYRFLDASARHGLVSFSLLNVDIVLEEQNVHRLPLRKGEFSRLREPESHAKVYLGIDIV